MVSGISTHTLTWSVTDFLRYAIGKIKISTHTLTWSVTLEKNIQCNHLQISTHTLTWSVTLEYSDSRGQTGNFNSHAHVERDGRKLPQNPIPLISTHTLTWSVT